VNGNMIMRLFLDYLRERPNTKKVYGLSARTLPKK